MLDVPADATLPLGGADRTLLVHVSAAVEQDVADTNFEHETHARVPMWYAVRYTAFGTRHRR
jgi:hypothetical protein